MTDGVDFLGFARGAEHVAKTMEEAGAAYACVGACAVEDGPPVALLILVRGEAECRDIQAACDAAYEAGLQAAYAAGVRDAREARSGKEVEP